MKTEPRSDEADWGGVGVFGEVGTEAEGGVSGGSVSGMLLKVILCGGSRSRGTGWPFSVPEVEVRTGRIPGDFSVYTVFLGWGGADRELRPARVQPRVPPAGCCTYKSGGLPAVPGLDVQRHLEQVVGKLLLSHGSHRVQVLEEPLQNRTAGQ